MRNDWLQDKFGGDSTVTQSAWFSSYSYLNWISSTVRRSSCICTDLKTFFVKFWTNHNLHNNEASEIRTLFSHFSVSESVVNGVEFVKVDIESLYRSQMSANAVKVWNLDQPQRFPVALSFNYSLMLRRSNLTIFCYSPVCFWKR